MSELANVKASAARLRKVTRDLRVIELCDLIFALTPFPEAKKATKVAPAPLPSAGCPVCALRRARKANAQKRWRQGRKK